MSNILRDKLTSLLKIQGSANTAEQLAMITDEIVGACKTEEQIEKVEAISKELYTQFKMDVSETPLIDYAVETILLNMSEEKAVALLDVYFSDELATLMGCIQQALDTFADGIDKMEAVVHPEYHAQTPTTMLM